MTAMRSSELALSPQVFAIFVGMLEEKAGLSYAISDRELLASKVSVRAIDLGFESLLDYYYYLRYDDGGGVELDVLVESLLVHETFFFRELDQLEMIVRGLLIPAVNRGERPRLWSAACSTGEEPLTLRMLLDASGIVDKVDIVASDVSREAVERAKSGRYNKRSLRQSSMSPLASRYISAVDDRLVVTRRLIDGVDWRVINLLDDAAVADVGSCDVVLCRNALFYFKDDVTRRVVARLTRNLKSGGFLFVSVAESLSRFGGPLVCEEHSGVFAYKKVGA